MVTRALGQHEILWMKGIYAIGEALNMPYIALNLSHYVNGVARKHGEVSRLMYAVSDIDSITNGVHAVTWTSKPFQELFDRYTPAWRENNFSLRHALNIPRQAIWDAHVIAKSQLFEIVKQQTGAEMDPMVLTLGFARRITGYKRPALLLQDIPRLKDISSRVGRLQVIYAGKAHPRDDGGKQIIQRITRARQELGDVVRLVFLPNYNVELGRALSAGVDVWLNTPEPPLEASGTSGMKAALNGVPSFSILDGWWIEGCIEGITGWAIGDDSRASSAPADISAHAGLLYEKLEKVVVPTFYQDRARFMNIMIHCIALNGSFFNTQRMILEYVSKAYLP